MGNGSLFLFSDLCEKSSQVEKSVENRGASPLYRQVREWPSIPHPDGNDVKPKPGTGRGDQPVLAVESLG